MKRLSVCLLALGCCFVLSSATSAKVRFVNLTKQDIYLAHSDYQVPAKGKPKKSAPQITEEGWLFSGWTTIAPGTGHEVDAGDYYLLHNGGPVTWKNLKTSKGLIKPRGAFQAFVSKARFNADFDRLLKFGHREAYYQHFDNGLYTFGTDYRLESQKFAFNFNSTNRQAHKRNFSVPGRVAYYDVSVAQNKGSNSIRWSQNTSVVTANGTTEGQASGFRGRFPATYRGEVTVHFVRQ